ncbi:MAG: DUF4145 domain-containing protein [Desulfarculaceae bacterium]|nr:DUF4145 domain-containing protein [Desulfarculaceae bacterium]MCF8071998.1 DUF4145 domain-containing protein [Desulfarculaceae bacterium]MCF8101515.1 DUF4145 domain-containing protein [Desulfarculaceae bacterium]MCF8115065.1 DUF4145 domain-containing protein [Desulfarculaceae bacterium]
MTFNHIGQDLYATGSGVVFGFRICPTPACQQIIAYADREHVINFWPAERLDFDPNGVPDTVVDTFEEALTCYAEGCFRTAAMAVRLTLETICDEQGAEGEKLFQRIDALVEKVVLPKQLLEVMHDIRWLGNDAAHIELKKFKGVGPEEVGAAIELTKEIMKGLYQLDSLVQRLRALKKTEGPSAS